jgi:hypothetical protein
MKMMILFAALLAGGATAAQISNSAASAPPPPAPPPPAATMTPAPAGAMQVCRADFEKLCPGMHPGDGKLGACIRPQMASLSAPCSAALRTMREQRRQ